MRKRKLNQLERKGFPFFAGIVAMAAMVFCSGIAQAGETMDLRGYGKVEATITPQRGEFVCESEEKADWLLGKLLADLFWDANGSHVEKTVNMKSGWLFVETMTVPVHLYPPYGALIAGRNKNRVMVFGGKDEQEAISRMKEDGGLSSGKAVFKPAKPYPIYLDFYDLRALKAYTRNVYGKDSFSGRWEFARKFLGGLVDQPFGRFNDTPAEGVVNGNAVWDYEFTMAEKNKVMYVLSPSTGAWPTWAWNKWPEFIGKGSRLEASGSQVFWAQANPEGAGLSGEQRERTSLKFLRDVMLRYRNSPVLGGWQLYCGMYQWETQLTSAALDCSPLAQEAFRMWIRDTRGLALSELGERWHGDKGRFNDWNEVNIPEETGFFGDLNESCFRIKDGWRWKEAEKGRESDLPAWDPAGWMPAEMPPSKQASTLPPGPAFWRVEFDPSAWLAENKGKDVYLVCNINERGWNEYMAWLNGKSLGKFKSKVRPYDGPFAVKLTGLLKDGKNALAISTPNKVGKIHGPVFLTTTRPSYYPYLGKNQNARYVDMRDWYLYSTDRKVEEAARYARSIDPDRPLIIPSNDPMTDVGQGGTCERYGASRQHTGREAWYFPWCTRTGYVAGYYGSSEASNNVETPALMDRMLGWLMIDGESSHFLYYNEERYMKMEKESGWFTKHKRLIDLFGKYLPEKPEIVILRSSRNALLGDPYETTLSWDVGRGELQSAHYDHVYANEDMLARGLADDYPVLFDSDTEIMSENTVNAIRRYVEQGGTFVALHNTGRHGILEPDTWPISQLTGFKVAAIDKKGKITFGKALPLFKGWEGKVFEGAGSALDWKNDEFAKDVSIGIAAASKDVIPLATWEDGTVAVGMRRLGKGRVVVLGSTFWRSGKDVSGIWKSGSDLEKAFFERLFTDLGVDRNAKASVPQVWTRNVITKNGLQEWAVAFNSEGAGLDSGCDIGFAVENKPSEVMDMLEEKPVPFEYTDGWVTIKDVAMGPYETRVFGIRRETLAEGIKFWWFEKEKFWKRHARVEPYTETAKENESNSPSIQFENWKFLADKDNMIGKTDDWVKPDFKDEEWRNIKTGDCNYQYEDLQGYDGIALYRSLPFKLPDNWSGKRIVLRMDYNHIRPPHLYINGMDIGRGERFCLIDVTEHLKKNGNILAIKTVGGTTLDGTVLNGLINGCVWMEPVRPLDPKISLAGEWQAVAGDYITRKPVIIPGTVEAKYLLIKVKISEKWKGGNVFIRFSPTPGLGGGMVMVNGQPILFGEGDVEVNLTPYAHFGQENEVVFWPNVTRNWYGHKAVAEETAIKLDRVGIGVEK